MAINHSRIARSQRYQRQRVSCGYSVLLFTSTPAYYVLVVNATE